MERTRDPGVYHPFDDNSPIAGNFVELRNRCAYNKTRGYILGVEIACGDFAFASLADRLPTLTPKSGAGLWMIPFKGIPETGAPVPLDLIYLDKDCRVIETVEFFPTFRVSPSSAPAASVLALPIHSIFASHTQSGDLVAFGQVEDVEQELALLFGSGAAAHAAHEARATQAAPAVVATPAPQREEVRPPEPPAAPKPAEAPAKSEAPKSEPPKKKSWLQRLISPDPVEPRKNTREALSGLTAYFWTGGNPLPHVIRDISSTGLYVMTEERWYPGTLIQMTLKKAGSGGPKSDLSIALHARSLRWGNDGVGLEFVVRDPRDPYNGADGATRAELDRFFELIRQS